MWRLKALVLLPVVAVTLLFGPLVAHAGGWQDDLADGVGAYGWYWNARLDVESVFVRTVWTVLDGNDQTVDGEADSYEAHIWVKLPDSADTAIVERADNERVHLIHTGGLDCKPDGIEAEVAYRVRVIGPVEGTKVAVVVLADGVHVDAATGHLGEKIQLQVLIPAEGHVPSSGVRVRHPVDIV